MSETAPAGPKPAAKEEHFLTLIPAKVIHAFGPILMAARENERLYRGALFLYPHEEGVLCLATNGIAMLAYLVRDERIALPRQILLPPALVKACAPPAPVTGWYTGWSWQHEVPEWMQPGRLVVFHHGAWIEPKMGHPTDAGDGCDRMALGSWVTADDSTYREHDYRHCEPTFDPRLVLSHERKEVPERLLEPTQMALFITCQDELNRDANGTRRGVLFEPGGPGGAITVRFDACPDLYGLIMPVSQTGTLPIPDFAAPVPPPAAG